MGLPRTVTCQRHWTGKQGRPLPAFTPISLAREDSKGRNTQKEGTGETVGLSGTQAESLALEITVWLHRRHGDRESAAGQDSINWTTF